MYHNEINIANHTVEDFAKLIIETTATFASLKEKVYSCKLDDDVTKDLMSRLSLAKERVYRNLEYHEILFYMLVPSRKIHGFSKKYFFNTDKEIKQGFKRRVNQYYAFSILGNFLYLLIILILVFVNSNNK